MPRQRPESTRRRRQAGLRLVAIESLEFRSLASESLGIMTAGIGVAAAAPTSRDAAAPARVPQPSISYAPTFSLRAFAPTGRSSVASPRPGTAALPGTTTTLLVMPAHDSPATLSTPAPNRITVSQPDVRANPSSGGEVGTSHGGSGATDSFGPAAPSPANPMPDAAGGDTPPVVVLPADPRSSSGRSIAQQSGTGHAGSSLQSAGSNSIGVALPFATLDVNAGQVIYPGAVHLATLGGNVELRAQVEDTTGASFSWNTSGLTKATAITGAGTAALQFQWATSNSVATTNSVTLSVTSGGTTTSQTYTFQVPAGSGATAGTGVVAWPQVISPDTVAASAPTFAVQNGSVDANSGAFNTSIALPSYNPNVPAVALTYNSDTARPQPIFSVHHTLDATQSVPSQVTAQLTFNGTVGSTAYTDTSRLIPGDVQRIGLQADASALATGRYSYSVTTGDVRSTTTTATHAGSANVVNNSASAIGSGWGVAGLQRIIPAPGGVMIDQGAGGKSLWFAAGPGSTFASPAGEFSKLVANPNGTYTRTLTNGFKIEFDSSGQETSALNTNGVGVAYAYNPNGSLSTVTDNYGNVTTFAYAGGLLASITDPANRVFSFTHSGTGLSGVTLPDSSTWGYGYDASGLMTAVTDPNGNAIAVGYDAAGRVDAILNPDSTGQSFTNVQESGLVVAGSSSAASPAAPSLLAGAGASMTDQRGHMTSIQTDWRGMGLAVVAIDALGHVSSAVRDGNGLVLAVLDPMNRISQRSYDAHANLIGQINADGTTASATYNTLARPLTTTDPMGRVRTYTYDGNGNKLTEEDPLGNRTTWTYSTTGQVASVTRPAIVGAGGSGGTSATPPMSEVMALENTFDPQDRNLSSTSNGRTTLYAFDAAGNVTLTTDPNNHTAGATYDAMNRILTATDGNGNTTTYTYDATGNRITVTDPNSQTTTTAYDEMNRPTTVTDARGAVTTTAYDLAGNVLSITDPVSNATSYTYDAANRLTATTDPFNHSTILTLNAAGETTSRTDRNGRTINYTRDAMGRVLTESWMVGSTAINTISRTYNFNGETTLLADNTTSLAYTYDAAGNAITVTTGGTSGQPAVTLTSTYGPDHYQTGLADNLSSAGSIEYTYDEARRLTSVASTYGGTPGPRVAFTYDPADNLTGMSRTIGSTGTAVNSNFVYDPGDRLTSITHQVGGGATLASYSYGYDAGNRLTSETNAGGSVGYSYDASNQLTGVSGARSEAYSYDDNGNRTMTGYATGTNNQLTAAPGYTYTYDDEQNLVSKTETATGNVWTYTWDHRNRLAGFVKKDPTGSTLSSGAYTYDPLDRRIRVQEVASAAPVQPSVGDAGFESVVVGSGNFNYNPVGSAWTFSNTSGTAGAGVAGSWSSFTGAVAPPEGSQVAFLQIHGTITQAINFTQAGSYRIDFKSAQRYYNAASQDFEVLVDGNVVGTYQPASTAYQALSSVVFTVAAGSHTIQFRGLNTAGGDNTALIDDVKVIGVAATTPGANYSTVYNGTNPYADFDAAGTLQTRYLTGMTTSRYFARVSTSGTTDWYLTDKSASVRDIANSSGTVIDHIAYDSYGNVTSESSPVNGDRIKFDGMAWDEALGEYYANARYYDQAVGRFVSSDPIDFSGGTSNLFSFAGNAPTNMSDPTGLLSWEDFLPPHYKAGQRRRHSGHKAIAGAGNDSGHHVWTVVVAGALGGPGQATTVAAIGNVRELMPEQAPDRVNDIIANTKGAIIGEAVSRLPGANIAGISTIQFIPRNSLYDAVDAVLGTHLTR